MTRSHFRSSRNAGNHHAAIGVADYHHVFQLLPFQFIDDVEDMGVEIDRRRQKMRAFAKSRERRREDIMSRMGEQPHHPPPAPGAVPGAVHENESGDALPPL